MISSSHLVRSHPRVCFGSHINTPFSIPGIPSYSISSTFSVFVSKLDCLTWNTSQNKRINKKISIVKASSDEKNDDNDTNSDLDWRSFRAKLIAQQQAEQSSIPSDVVSEDISEFDPWQDRLSLENMAVLSSQNPDLANESIWAHPISEIEKGAVLLASPEMTLTLDSRYWQTVVFMIKHDQEGSRGLILNRPSGFTIQKAMGTVKNETLEVFQENPIYVGGFLSDGKTLFFLHGHDLPGAVEIIPGIYSGGLESAAKQVKKGNLKPTDFRFFIGHVEWIPGRLKSEKEKNIWFVSSCSRNLVLKQCIRLPKPLWREIMELMGGEYSTISKKEYGETS